MAKKLDPMDLKQIIRLHLEGLSNREVSKTLGIGRNAINNYIQLFKACDISLEDILGLSESAFKELFSSRTTIKNGRYDQLMWIFRPYCATHSGASCATHSGSNSATLKDQVTCPYHQKNGRKLIQ